MAVFRRDESRRAQDGEIRTRIESTRGDTHAVDGLGEVEFDEHVVDERSIRYVQVSAATVNGLLGIVLITLESLLFARFMLLAFGASTRSGFVRFVLDVSHPFLRPFSQAFRNRTWDQGVVEPATLLAIGIYAAVFALAMVLIQALMPHLTERRRTEQRHISRA